MVSRPAGSDAAGLAFDAVEQARKTGADVVLIDTAGRLQNKAGLMAELEKIVRVLKKLDATAPHATLLVLDATTGQNAISQVEAFKAAVPLTGPCRDDQARRHGERWHFWSRWPTNSPCPFISSASAGARKTFNPLMRKPLPMR